MCADPEYRSTNQFNAGQFSMNPSCVRPLANKCSKELKASFICPMANSSNYYFSYLGDFRSGAGSRTIERLRCAELAQSCPGRAWRGQEQTGFAARYASYKSDAPQHRIKIGE